LADLNIEGIISGDCVFPIDFDLEFGIETSLSLLMKSSALELIPTGQSPGLEENCILEDGWPLFFRLIRSHSVTAVASLCRLEVDLHWKSLKGWTTIHIADQERQPAVCRILIEAGADPQMMIRFGFTPLELASGRHLVEFQREIAHLIRERIATEEAKVHDCQDIC
jgi:ankyrin repeat protein